MRRAWLLAVTIPLLAGGCESDPEVVVSATAGAQGAAAPITELPVRLLPYNRDSIIAELQEKARKPQPQVPPELLAQIDSLQSVSGARARDTLAAARERTLRTLRARVDSIREARREWSAETLAGFDAAVRKRLDALDDMEELVDTTDASGNAKFRAVPGRWWVFSRYLLPDRELYWNVPIEVASGATQVQLSPSNAESRPAP